MSRTRIQAAVERIEFARGFTKLFLDTLTPDDWFWQPSEFTTHIAWQVGHLAMAEYGLCLQRVRGRVEADEALMPQTFFEHFKLGSHPAAGAENNPPREEIEQVFAAVHQQTLAELAGFTDAELDTPTDRPHPVFNTKLGAVEWCSSHELVHAGQIALLRRLMGKRPLR